MGGKQVQVLNLPVGDYFVYLHVLDLKNADLTISYLFLNLLQIYKVDTLQNLLYVEGHVPGNKGGFVSIQDAFYKKQPAGIELPRPTKLFSGEDTEFEIYAPSPKEDPIKYDTSA